MRDLWTFTMKDGEVVRHATSLCGMSTAQAVAHAGLRLHEVERADVRRSIR